VSRAGRAGIAVLVAATVAGPVAAVHTTAACAAGGARVAFAIDFGGAPGAPSSSVVLTCVPVSGGTGADALAARAQELGTPQPRYASSGLLCAIDGFPASGCGDRTGNGYAYWSYWHGTAGGWSYGTGGPAGWPVSTGDLEGWRFQDPGTGTAADPPPRASPSASAICPPAPPPTTPPPTTPPSTTPSSTTPPSPSPRSTSPPPTAPRAAAPPVTGPVASVAAPPGHPTTAPSGTTPPSAALTTTTSTTTVADTATGPARLALSPPFVPRRNGSGPPWSLILGGAAVALLGGAAVWRWRRPRDAA
jgi:hypothetical protein